MTLKNQENCKYGVSEQHGRLTDFQQEGLNHMDWYHHSRLTVGVVSRNAACFLSLSMGMCAYASVCYGSSNAAAEVAVVATAAAVQKH